jgi:hypothetical protein
MTVIKNEFSGVTRLENGDIVYQNHIWWSEEYYKAGRNPIGVNFDDPVNCKFTFDKDGNLKNVEVVK